MTVEVNTRARNLRPNLAREAVEKSKRGTPLLPQDTRTGDGSETTFVCLRGQKPYAVFLQGSLQLEGSGNDYTVTQDGELYSVVFGSAPANLDEISIWPQEV